MSALTLAILLSLGAQPASPAVGTILLQQSGLTEAEVRDTAVQLQQALKAGGVTISDELASVSCTTEKDCVHAWGKRLRLDYVIALDVAATRKSFAVNLAAVAVVDGKRILIRDFVGSREKFWSETRGQVTAFASELAALIAPSPAPQSASDLPREMKLDPPAPAPRLEMVEPPTKSTGQPLVLALGGGAAASAVAAIGLAVGGYLVQHRTTVSGDRVETYWSDAQDNARLGGNLYLGAGVAAGTAAALAAATYLLWQPEAAP